MALALLPAAMLALASCSSTEPEAGTTATSHSAVVYEPGVPGGVAVATIKVTATVTAIDRATREVTLVAKDGAKTTVKAGPDVANFAQIEVGDKVKAIVTDQLVIFVRKPGEPAGSVAAGIMALAPVGDKPGGVMADTVEFNARVKSVDLKRHTATLHFPDGSSRTFPVREDVELTQQTVGTDVVIRTTQAVAISVEKP